MIFNFIQNLLSGQTIDKALLWENVLDYFINIFLPLFASFIFAWAVGFERQNVGKSAGISAHVLVSVAACAVAIMQRNLFFVELAEGKANPDGQRIVAQVISGMGFLGAGVILKSNRSVKGLTTAASVWTCAILGIIVGMGEWSIGLTLGFFVVIFLYSRDMIRKFNPFIIHTKQNDASMNSENQNRKEATDEE